MPIPRTTERMPGPPSQRFPRLIVRLTLVALVACAPACGGDDGGEAIADHDASMHDAVDAASDTGEGDADETDGGDGEDVVDADDAPEDTADDAAAADADAAEDDVRFEFPPCDPPPEGPAPPLGRWSLSLFHFNIQYVAGGLEGFVAAAASAPGLEGEIDISEEEVEDLIITESFVPLIEILERNPDFALTLELQGFMLDVIAARHAELLPRMRALTESEQLELASTHWSDQFFLAFGRQEMDESWERTLASFEAVELPLSRAVFTQEGQFGPGFAEWLVETRPDAIMVMARNLQGFFQDDLVDQPLWTVRGLDVVLPRGMHSDQVQKTFSFFDDGELLATGDLNPYVGPAFVRDERSIQRYEHELRCAVERGYRVGRLTDYVDTLDDAGVEPVEMPPFMDGTWQPRSTRGPLRWMGGAGLFTRYEDDNDVLLACNAAREPVIALQLLVDSDEFDADESLMDTLDQSWRHLLWGQVSDARGVNPWLGEVEYGLFHCGEARRLASAALAEAVGAGRIQRFDLLEETIETVAALPATPARESAESQLDVTVTESVGRDANVEWFAVDHPELPDTDVWEVVVSFSAPPDSIARFASCIEREGETEWSCAGEPNPLAVQFPRVAGRIEYRPALSESPDVLTESDFTLQQAARDDAIWTTGADGYFGLGEDRYVVKQTDSVHVALGWPAGEGRNGVVELRDETVQPRQATTWRFWYTEDRDAALHLAARNLSPVVYVEGE